jgi:hypothetical protein
MSLIFDRFPSAAKAEAFAAHVRETFSRDAEVFGNQDESDAHDPFPFALDGPIVHVERFEDYSQEETIIQAVRTYDGSFAGT